MTETNSPKRFCKILDWIRLKDEEFADAIDVLCLSGLLNPNRRGTDGITFLFPEDKKDRKKFIEMAYSDDKTDEASRHFMTLVIPTLVTSLDDFKGDIGSFLEVKYTFSNGKIGDSKVSPSDFKPMITYDKRSKTSNTASVAVWNISNALSLPVTGESYRIPFKKRKVGKEVTGGCIGGAGGTRSRITQDAEAACMGHFANCKKSSPYLTYVVSFLNFYKKRMEQGDEGSRALLRRVLPFIDYSPFVTFYLLFEPYRRVGTYLVSNEELELWGGVNVLFDAALDDYLDFFEKMPTYLSGSAMGDNPREVIALTDAIRQCMNTKPTYLMKSEVAKAAYARIGQENVLEVSPKYCMPVPSIPKLYTVEAFDALGNSDCEKANRLEWMNTFRHWVDPAAECVYTDPVFDSQGFVDMLTELRGWTGDPREASVFASPLGPLNVEAKLRGIHHMQYSTDLVYMPTSLENLGTATNANPYMTQEDTEVWNRNASARRRLSIIGELARPAEEAVATTIRSYFTPSMTIPAATFTHPETGSTFSVPPEIAQHYTGVTHGPVD